MSRCVWVTAHIRCPRRATVVAGILSAGQCAPRIERELCEHHAARYFRMVEPQLVDGLEVMQLRNVS